MFMLLGSCYWKHRVLLQRDQVIFINSRRIGRLRVDDKPRAFHHFLHSHMGVVEESAVLVQRNS